MRYWTFLIAANRQFDYRPAICPDFVKSGKRDFFRRNLDARSYASEGTNHAARIEDSELGPIELFYVTEFVRDADKPGAFVYDDSGRRFYFTHGIVARPERRTATPGGRPRSTGPPRDQRQASTSCCALGRC